MPPSCGNGRGPVRRPAASTHRGDRFDGGGLGSTRLYNLSVTMLADLDERFPLLAGWMRGAKPGHIWGYEIRDDLTEGDSFKEYESIEVVLRTLHDASPGRLDGKRREFRGVRTAG